MTENKPREFWIKFVLDSADGIIETVIYGVEPKVIFDYHVIEYSAFEQLQKENKDLKVDNNRLVYELDKSRSDHMKIIQQLKSKLKIAKDALVMTRSRLKIDCFKNEVGMDPWPIVVDKALSGIGEL